MTTAPQPADYTHGIGELIRALRLYIGLSHQHTAALTGMDRRDYQHVESGRDACPPGLLGRMRELADKFDDEVGRLVVAMEAHGSDDVTVSAANEWERLVVLRATVELMLDPDATVSITPILVG